MGLVATALTFFSVYMSYAARRDVIQDIVSAKRVLRGESAYPEQMNSLIKEGSEPASWSLSKYFPGLREKEERESRPVLQYQAHPPLLVLLTVPLVFMGGSHGAALLMDLISLAALAVTVMLIRKGLAVDLPLCAGLAILAAILAWTSNIPCFLC